MKLQTAKKTKKGRKHGRNKKWCENYRNRGQRERNKLRRLVKHLTRHPGDRCASAAEGACRAAI